MSFRTWWSPGGLWLPVLGWELYTNPSASDPTGLAGTWKYADYFQKLEAQTDSSVLEAAVRHLTSVRCTARALQSCLL